VTRPQYESQLDRQNEQIVAKVIQGLGYEMTKLPPHYRLDYVVMRDGKPKAFVEVKARTFEMQKYPTALVNLHKVIAARQLSFETDLPSYMLVLYKDALARISFAEDFELGFLANGRKDRDDPMDRDLVCHYPISRFTVLL
jgi:hypothetical protein